MFLSRKSRNQNKVAHEQISAHTYTAKKWTIIVSLHNTFVLFQYVLTQIYLGRSHICRSLFLAILGRRKKGLRSAALASQNERKNAVSAISQCRVTFKKAPNFLLKYVFRSTYFCYTEM